METENIFQAAKIIMRSRRLNLPISTLPASYRPKTIEDGYRIQRALQKLINGNSGKTSMAYKIGCTTTVMQKFLDIDHPCAGTIMDSEMYYGTAELNHSNYVLPGVECEIVARLKNDIPLSVMNSPKDVAPYIDALMIGIEIVENRYVDFRSMGVPTLIADDFFNAGCVLGKPIKNWEELEICELKGGFIINGKRGPLGQGADIMGHPLAALAWLVNQTAIFGQQLKAGSYVMLGSLVETYWFESPGQAVARIPELGEVSVAFK